MSSYAPHEANNQETGGKPRVRHPPGPYSSTNEASSPSHDGGGDGKESSSANHRSYQPQEANNKRVIHPPAPTQEQQKNDTHSGDVDQKAAAKEPRQSVKDQPRTGYRKDRIGAQWDQKDLEGEDFEAALEHANLSNMWSPLSLIRKEYGAGVYVYFKYLVYLVGINAAIGLFGMIFYIIAAAKGLSTGIYSGLDLLFLGAVPHSAKTEWYGLISVSMLGAFAAAPIYQRYQRYITDQWKNEE